MQAHSEVMHQPIYRAWQFLTNRMTEDALPSPSDNPQAQGAGRLDIAELNNMGLPIKVVEALKARKMTTKNGCAEIGRASCRERV